MTIIHGRGTREEITIGVVGGEDLVYRVMTVAREAGSPSWRLIPSVYMAETDAHAAAMRIATRVDVCLFAGPLPRDVAVGGGDLPVPATYIPVGGSALYSALLRATLEGLLDPRRTTIDSVSSQDVRAAYQEVGLDPTDVRVQPYVSSATAEQFLDFHQAHYRRGETTGAITTVPTVATGLADAGIPSLKMRPTAVTLRDALQTAALVGSGARLEESRIVTMVVQIPGGIVPEHVGPSNYWYQELRLSLQRELLREARAMDATVLPRDGRGYLVITTMGSLTTATDELTVAPFLERVATELGMDIEVGIGLGRSTREAEFNAQAAVDKAVAAGGGTAYLIGPHDTVLQLPADRRMTVEQPLSPGRDAKAVETLRRLVAKLDEQHDRERVVDAEKVAELLGVTLRTARRTLHTLVAEGLAWPMPPARSNKLGRPPRPYQLLVEKVPS